MVGHGGVYGHADSTAKTAAEVLHKLDPSDSKSHRPGSRDGEQANHTCALLVCLPVWQARRRAIRLLFLQPPDQFILIPLRQ